MTTASRKSASRKPSSVSRKPTKTHKKSQPAEDDVSSPDQTSAFTILDADGHFIEGTMAVPKSEVSLTGPTEPSTVPAIATPRSFTIFSKFSRLTREITAIVIWTYAVTKLFVYDLDVAIFEYFFPATRWLLSYKIVAFLLILVFCMIFVKRKTWVIWFSFIAFYPLINLIWRLPIFLYRATNWLVPFAILNGFVSFFRSFKYNVVICSLWVVAFILSLSMHNQWVLVTSAVTLVGVTFTSYVMRFLSVFKSSPLATAYRTVVTWIDYHIRNSYKVENGLREKRDSLDGHELETWRTALETTILFNRLSLFFAFRLREFQNSGLIMAGGIVAILVMLFGTTLNFAAVNFALYKLHPASFSVTEAPTFFSFFYYSFNSLVFNFIDEVRATDIMSKSIWMLEVSFALFLVAILIALVVQVRSEKSSIELTGLIRLFEERGAAMEEFIRQQFSMATIEDALDDLKRMKSSILVVLLYLTARLR